MRGLMKLAGVARFDCIGSTQEFTCYMAGLASPRRSHLRLDDQHAAQSPCLAILVPLGMWRLIDNKRHRGSGGWPHPLPAFYRPRSRSAAPDPSRYTRSVAVHPIRRGAMPTDRVHRLPQQAQMRAFPSDIPNRQHRTQPHSCKMLARLRTRGATPVRERYTTPSWCNTTKQHAQSRAIPPHRPLPSASDAATRPRHAHPGSEREALHQLASITPPPSWCNTPLRGVTPARNKQQCGYALQHASQYARQAAQRRLRRRFTTEKQAPATRPLTAALISCLDTAPTEPDALASISFGCAGTAMPSAGS